jgi:Fe-S oxidoreductase
VSIHDSCPDRTTGVFADGLRRLASTLEIREMEHNRKYAHCCGSGYLLSLRDAEMSERLNRERLQEFEQTGAALLLSSCVNCTNALQERAATRQSRRTYHYLELLFGIEIDWEDVEKSSAKALELR